MDPESSTEAKCRAKYCGGRWTLIALLAIVLGCIVLARLYRSGDTVVSAGTSNPSQNRSRATNGQTVSLTIHFADDDERRFDKVAWREGMTVDDLMTAVSRQRDGISYAIRGAGSMALLTRIDKMQNEGVRGRNWTYTVNGVRADRSFAVYPLRPGDQVLWTFAAPE